MPNDNLKYTNDDSLSIEQPPFEKFYYKNTEVLNNLLKISNHEIWIGLPESSSYQDSINMRTIMIKWLRQINSFRLSKPGVLALTVEIIDYYVYLVLLSSPDRKIDKKNYQCVGASAYYLASKLEEVSPISASDMSKFTSESCSPKEIMDLEIILSFKLNFNINFITPIDFIYSLVAFLKISDDPADLIKFAIDCYLEVIDNYYVKEFPTFVIAVNCIIVGYYDFEVESGRELESIVDTLINLTQPEKKQLSACYDLILKLINANKAQAQYSEDSSSHEHINGN